MPALTLRVPTGFSSLSGMIFSDETVSPSMSSADVENINQGEDLAFADHLFLDASVHLDALQGAFVITIFRGEEGEEVSQQTRTELHDAVRTFEATLRDIWHVDVPWRAPDTPYHPPPDAERGESDPEHAWIVSGGWTVLLDALSESPPAPVAGEPVRLVFAASSSHRTLAVYRIDHEAAPAPYAGFLWTDPVGRLYERVFFPAARDIDPWLRARLIHGSLPRRKKRR